MLKQLPSKGVENKKKEKNPSFFWNSIKKTAKEKKSYEGNVP